MATDSEKRVNVLRRLTLLTRLARQVVASNDPDVAEQSMPKDVTEVPLDDRLSTLDDIHPTRIFVPDRLADLSDLSHPPRRGVGRDNLVLEERDVRGELGLSELDDPVGVGDGGFFRWTEDEERGGYGVQRGGSRERIIWMRVFGRADGGEDVARDAMALRK